MTARKWRDAWVEALESALGADRRTVGRSLVERGGVVDVEPRPGGVSARVLRARGAEPHVVDLALPVVDSSYLEAMIDEVSQDPRSCAAVLTGGLPDALLDDERDRPSLLPPADEWVGECTCGEWARLCEHLGAVGWRVADLIEADPHLLLTMRGVGPEELVAAVRSRRGSSGPTSEPRDPDPGVPVAEALRSPVSELPRAQPLPWSAGEPVSLGRPPPADSGLDRDALAELVGDAATRAATMLRGDAGTGLDLSVDEDLVRRAANSPERLQIFADQLGWTSAELRAATDAWAIGGRAGLRVLLDRWSAPEASMAEAAVVVSGRSRISFNVLSGPGFQLRLDRDGRWWRLRPDDELGWVLATEAFDDPADAMEAPELSPS